MSLRSFIDKLLDVSLPSFLSSPRFASFGRGKVGPEESVDIARLTAPISMLDQIGKRY